MKSVLVVGGGPAGLVAAKTLLQHAGGTAFRVTLFEAADRVGGMWRFAPDEHGEICSPHMRTNLSRFTVAFPDFSWRSINFPDDSETPGHPPMFPRAWQVGRYLEAYANRFLPPNVVHLNRRVTAADFVSSGHAGTWNVTSVDQTTQQELSDSFDLLIVASGFFQRPNSTIPRSQGHEEAERILHSTQFRNVESFSKKAGKVVVIGGGISASEAAATAAFQISCARNSPGQKPDWAESKVYHVFDRPFYILPRYLPQDPYNPAIQGFNLSPRFLPLDLILYNLGRRGTENEITASVGPVAPEKAEKGHEFIRTLLGGDQRATGSMELVYKPDMIKYPAFTGISDLYSEFVREGLIVPVRGRVNKITQIPGSDFEIHVSAQGPWTNGIEKASNLDGVTGVIEATGFQSHLEYLSDSVREALDYDSECHRVPFLLSRGSVFNGNIPQIAFVGFYEGPFWGIMDLQAQIIARRWAQEEGRTENIDTTDSLSVRQCIKSRALDIGQFWMADYVGFVEEFARNLSIQRDDSLFGNSGPLFPSRYPNGTQDEEANAVLQEVADVLQTSEKEARYVAAAAFQGMQGAWTLLRKIDSRHPSMPSGSFKGTANFHPRTPTDATYSAEYLYVEQGTLTMDNGLSFPATRRYVYRYNERTDTITAWFADEDGLSTSSLFNTWEFYAPDDTYHGWLARGHHWCSPDTYSNNCEFRFRGASLETFGITYNVTGPKKDYSHESWYSRPVKGSTE